MAGQGEGEGVQGKDTRLQSYLKWRGHCKIIFSGIAPHHDCLVAILPETRRALQEIDPAPPMEQGKGLQSYMRPGGYCKGLPKSFMPFPQELSKMS